ncbi:helix-turn-helix domain-containing protein [Halogeometricum luteum]|uniref:Helix-turn-helix domain-containing protein n=1 Tax=Halogeometricum luteum TaxID=2950537 RepID=A0ABU2G6G5_9EURY|nr:helix-turn-helix domain-containing protein [Halogeometricum sp. S3BR5-2]MDS0295873.1 helix-turn-helix domain-containing protein [Halogeometricum sp. S3BR5-2]
MSVVVEFALPAESFPFGRSTSGDPSVRVQLERLVPLNKSRIPFLWATGEDLEQFERHLRESEVVKRVEAVTRVGNSVLYQTEWDTDKETFLNGISDQDGAIMEGHSNSEWSFTVRFPNHAALTGFHQFYQAHDYPVRIDRVYSPGEASRREYGFGLTPEQRDTLMMAVEDGYFSVPRGTTLSEIADEVGVTKQAASERVRRGTETVLRKALIGLIADDFEPADEA